MERLKCSPLKCRKLFSCCGANFVSLAADRQVQIFVKACETCLIKLLNHLFDVAAQGNVFNRPRDDWTTAEVAEDSSRHERESLSSPTLPWVGAFPAVFPLCASTARVVVFGGRLVAA